MSDNDTNNQQPPKKTTDKPKNRLMESFIGANQWQKPTNENEKILGKDSYIAEYSDFKSVRHKNWLMDNFYGVGWQVNNNQIAIDNIQEYYGSFANYRVGIELHFGSFVGVFYLNINEFMPYLKLMVYPADILKQPSDYINHGLEIILRKIVPAGVNIGRVNIDTPPDNYDNVYMVDVSLYNGQRHGAPKKLKIIMQSQQLENLAEYIKNQSHFTQFQSNHCDGLMLECNLFCGHATITLNDLQHLAVGDVLLFSQELKFS